MVKIGHKIIVIKGKNSTWANGKNCKGRWLKCGNPAWAHRFISNSPWMWTAMRAQASSRIRVGSCQISLLGGMFLVGQRGEAGLEQTEYLFTLQHHWALPIAHLGSRSQWLPYLLWLPCSRVNLTPTTGAARSSLKMGMALWKQLNCIHQHRQRDRQVMLIIKPLYQGVDSAYCCPGDSALNSFIYCLEMLSGSLEPPGKL